MALCQELGYVSGVVPSDVASLNGLKSYIQTCWMVDAKTKEERKRIFVSVARAIFFLLGLF